jgi:transposase-like protein
MAAKQRKYTAQFKAKVVLEVLRGEKSPADACRVYKIHNSVLTRWKREFLDRAHQAFENGEQNHPEAGRIAELEQMVGRLTMQLEIAKKASGGLSGDKGGSW